LNRSDVKLSALSKNAERLEARNLMDSGEYSTCNPFTDVYAGNRTGRLLQMYMLVIVLISCYRCNRLSSRCSNYVDATEAQGQ
jgi:hypothetical protein